MVLIFVYESERKGLEEVRPSAVIVEAELGIDLFISSAWKLTQDKFTISLATLDVEICVESGFQTCQ